MFNVRSFASSHVSCYKIFHELFEFMFLLYLKLEKRLSPAMCFNHELTCKEVMLQCSETKQGVAHQ